MQPAIAIPKEHGGTVAQTATLTPKIILLTVQAEAPLSYSAGQYASFLIDTYRRPLSYATPAHGTALEFIVDISPGGIASTFVAQLKPQDQIRFMSPYGRFIVDQASDRSLLFVATGSGIAPIRAQILHQLTVNPGRPMTLLFGNKDERHLFLDDEFTRLAQQHAVFSYIPVCSEPSAAWTGERGLVTQVISRRIAHAAAYDAYICGNPGMVKDVKTLLEATGLRPEQLHTEQFS